MPLLRNPHIVTSLLPSSLPEQFNIWKLIAQVSLAILLFWIYQDRKGPPLSRLDFRLLWLRRFFFDEVFEVVHVVVELIDYGTI